MKIVPDTKYPKMFRIKFSDGELSDMYNLSRAKNHMAVIRENESRMKRRMAGIEATEARTCV